MWTHCALAPLTWTAWDSFITVCMINTEYVKSNKSIVVYGNLQIANDVIKLPRRPMAIFGAFKGPSWPSPHQCGTAPQSANISVWQISLSDILISSFFRITFDMSGLWNVRSMEGLGRISLTTYRRSRESCRLCEVSMRGRKTERRATSPWPA